MSEYSAALGRSVGKVDTDAGGMARYSLKLQLPPGISPDVEPELSLEYCSGTHNGSLGVGWALGGLSCIRTAPSDLAYDGVNPGPPNYDRSQAKLTLDGTELLNVDGDYYAPNAKYMAEIDDKSRVVTALNSGFLSVDSRGVRAEYGTSDDSRVLGVANVVREWRLKQMSDYHGNTAIYTYAANPQANGSKIDENTCYISSIRYTSNSKTGLEGKRLVKFEYSSRPDVFVQCVQGVRCRWASLLTKIHIGVLQDGSFISNRSYEIEYSTSIESGDSFLQSITEATSHNGQKTRLLPSTFGYSTSGVPRDAVFSTLNQSIATLPSTVNNVALFSMNISGRCLADLACFRFDPRIRELSVKTYLADVNADGIIRWNESKGPAGVATLPPIDTTAGFPSILCPDITNDGRADFIVPYSNGGKLAFSVSQSVGTGFLNARPLTTRYDWTGQSKFMTLDCPGRGPSILEIFTYQDKLAFRNFPTTVRDGIAEIQDPATTSTGYKNQGTIDWIQLNHAGTGAKSLVRVWEDPQGMGYSQIKATTFTIDRFNNLKEAKTSPLGNPLPVGKAKQNVLSCDINADGTQDIVLATAQFVNDQILLTYSTFLGDGYGGFRKHGDDAIRRVNSDTPQAPFDFGSFHITNLNGSNYPSLSYVYQTKYSKSYICISVDGRCDGSVGAPSVYKLLDRSAFDKTKVIATDLKGEGIGDWLFYTLDGGGPRLIPVYNRSRCVDLMSWAQDSMGLRTDLTYAPLSDEKIYQSGVRWDDYKKNNSKDSYPVIAAQNYVVARLEHRNEASVNSLTYKAIFSKSYAKARINFLGRGWQGFSEINTLNETDGILTTETYLQDWPLTGAKTQVDTKTRNGEVLRSVIVGYQKSSRSKGPWNIYKTEKTSEEIIFMDSGKAARSIMTRYAYNADGDMILRNPSETQRGKLMYQFWDRCAYTTIDGVQGVLVAHKTSTYEKNIDMTKFEPGDISFKTFENESSRAALKSISTWSTDHQSFSKELVTIDEYGRQAKLTDAAGLQKTVVYDTMFQTFPIRETERGPGVSATKLTAFDTQSGLETACLDTKGLLTCRRLDGFGRTLETRIADTHQRENTMSGSQLLANNSYVADADLIALLGRSHFHPQRKISFERVLNGAAHVATKMTTYSKEGVDGEQEICEYVDCTKAIRKVSSRNGSNLEKSWLYWERSLHGQPVFESFPVKTKMGIEWIPDKSNGTKTTFDLLGRPMMQIRPAHGKDRGYIITLSTYLDGGARIQEKTLSVKTPDSPLDSATLLAKIERRYIQIEKEDLVIENIDENGLTSKFEYDIRGKLTRCIDPSGQVETRVYNSLGALISLDNSYQNVAQTAGIVATKLTYDLAGYLVRETNALGQSVTYERDAKARTLRKIGADGRTLACSYDQQGFEGVSSIAMKDPRGAPESLVELTYDHCGRLKERKLTLANGKPWTTSVSYDWQDQITQKMLPNGVAVTNEYRGSEIASSALSGSNWTLTTATPSYNSFGRPEVLKLQTSGIKETFTHTWQYDSQGFPLAHRLDNSNKTLVDERYQFNGTSQLELKHDFLSGVTTTYQYLGKRLSSTRVGTSQANSYQYDLAGNLTQNRDVTLLHSPGKVKGMKNNVSIVEAIYDQAGRLVERNRPDSPLRFSYDTFGTLSSIKNSNQTTNIISDYTGEMLQRQQPDGSSDLFLSSDISIHRQSDGSQLVRYHLFNEDNSNGTSHQIGTISMSYESEESTRPLGATRRLDIQFTDTKGNITHTFRGEDSSLRQKLEYDDFGLLNQAIEEDVAHSTYEGNLLDRTSGLLNFGARWYDPLIGRFTTPDDILDIASCLLTDGLNRYAFENNDPVNHVDPTGHWSWSAIVGVAISAYLVWLAVGLTIATGGAATPLAAAIVGALAAGGIAGIMYSFEHKDEENAGKFWGGFGMTVAINAAIGGAAGYLGASAPGASWGAKFLVKGFLTGTASVLSKLTERGVENVVYGKPQNWGKGLLKTFVVGFIVGGVFSLFSSGKTPRIPPRTGFVQHLRTGVEYTRFLPVGAGKGVAKFALKSTPRLAIWQMEKAGWMSTLEQTFASVMSDLEKELSKLPASNNQHHPGLHR